MVEKLVELSLSMTALKKKLVTVTIKFIDLVQEVADINTSEALQIMDKSLLWRTKINFKINLPVFASNDTCSHNMIRFSISYLSG